MIRLFSGLRSAGNKTRIPASRTEIAKKFFLQAKKMTLAMTASVFVYGVAAYFLVREGKAGPAILNAQTYPLVKYGALFASVAGVFAIYRWSQKKIAVFPSPVPNTDRPPQRIFLKTIMMNTGAEWPVLLGMLLVYFGRRPLDYIPFAVISLAGFMLAFPRKNEWVSWLGADF